MCKSWEDYDKNWMHFVYKLDHLFQSTRVSDKNSSVTKTFHFSKLISTQDIFCIQHATFKATYWNSNPFWLHLIFFMHLTIYFQLITLKLERATTWTQKRLKHGMVSSFVPHNMCAKVERIMAKTRCTSCTNCTISFKERGFQTKTHMLQRHFIFLNLFQLKTFLHPKCNIESHILKFQPFLTSFATFHAFNDLLCAKWPWNWKALQLNLEKVETWHGIIIWPT